MTGDLPTGDSPAGDVPTGDSPAGDYLSAGLRAAERRLQAAQLASDVAALDELLDDRLVFTGPDGKVYSKQDDLHVHRSGDQVLTKVRERELAVLVVGRTGLTWFLGELAGTFGGAEFEATVRYTRTWTHSDEHGWRLLAAHVSSAGSV